MNLRRSKIGSSSCQCTTTFCGEHREIMKIEWRSPGMLQHVPTSSRKDVGHFWDLDQSRIGTELVQINQTEIGTRLLNE